MGITGDERPAGAHTPPVGTGAAATWDRDPRRFGRFGTNSPCYGPWRQHACQIRGKITMQFEIMKFVRKTNPSGFALLFRLWDVNPRLKGFVLQFTWSSIAVSGNNSKVEQRAYFWEGKRCCAEKKSVELMCNWNVTAFKNDDQKCNTDSKKNNNNKEK